MEQVSHFDAILPPTIWINIAQCLPHVTIVSNNLHLRWEVLHAPHFYQNVLANNAEEPPKSIDEVHIYLLYVIDRVEWSLPNHGEERKEEVVAIHL